MQNARVVAPQGFVNPRYVPCRVTKLETMATPSWESGKKLVQSLNVELPAGRQLKQRGPEPPPQSRNLREKLLVTLFRVFQFAVMSNVAAGLDGKAEFSGGFAAPGGERFGRGKSVKAVVNLDRIKMLRVPS